MLTQHKRTLDGSNGSSDGHSSHFDGVEAQHQACSSHSDRAVRLYREDVVYPSRVRVYVNTVSRVVE